MNESKIDEVLGEVAKFLTERNKKRRFEFIDRPFFLMLIGGLLLTLLTTAWNSCEKINLLELQYKKVEIEKKFQLVKACPSHYSDNATFLNNLIFYRIRYAEEKLKNEGEQDTDRLKETKKRILEAEKNLSKAESLAGTLSHIEILFVSDKVQTAVKIMGDNWEEYTIFADTITKRYNSKEYSQSDINDWDKTRIRLVDELEKSAGTMFKHLKNEVFEIFH